MATASDATPLRRDAIVRVAREMVRDGGVDSLSLRQLAARFGVTAPALYAHVNDKRDLLRAIAEVEFDALVARFEAVTDADPIERLRSYNRAYVDHARENPELFQAMFAFPPDIGPVAHPTEESLPAATRAFVLALEAVEKAINAGAVASAEPVVVALSLWSAAHGVASTLLLGLNLDENVEELVIDQVIDRLLQGWST